jgi:long-chain fatty acid transport protein
MTAALLSGLAMLMAPGVHAAAFYVSEFGTPGSLGTAGVANTTNTFGTDSAFTNPAGMTGLKEDSIVGGMQLLIPEIKFDSSIAEAGGKDGGNAGNVAAIPSLFAVKVLDDRTRIGFSVTGPLGGGMNYGDDFVGRYGAQKVVLTGVELSPSLGYRVTDRLSLGVGVSALYTSFEETIAINNNFVPGPVTLPDSKVKLENMDDWSWQGFAGLTFQLTEQLLLGVVYRSKSDINLKGDLNIRSWQLPIPQPTANSAKLQWDNPQLVEAGLRYKLNEEWYLMANADWEEWSEFSDNFLSVQRRAEPRGCAGPRLEGYLACRYCGGAPQWKQGLQYGVFL